LGEVPIQYNWDLLAQHLEGEAKAQRRASVVMVPTMVLPTVGGYVDKEERACRITL
jgi:hypothetical protein